MSSFAFDAIEKVASTSSKNEKENILREYFENETLARVLEYAYCPFRTYGIASISAPTNISGECEFDESTWTLLDNLVARTLTGNAARDAVARELCRLNLKSSKLLCGIIRKDVRAGFSESTINKVWKGKIKTFPYMRCTLPKDAKLDEFDWKLGVLSQEKADGMFANIDYESTADSSAIRITSRQGSPFPIERFVKLANAVEKYIAKNTQCHGELLVMKLGAILPREISNGILNSVLSGGHFGQGESPVYFVWDQIPLSAVKTKGKYEVPYIARFNSLKSQLIESPTDCSVAIIDTRVYHSLSGAYGHYRDLLAKGKEGTIIKNPHAIWKDGTSKEQVKLKLEVDVDLKVIGIVPGKADGKNEGRAGSLTCRSSCGELVTDVTVKNEAMRSRIDANPDDWIDRIIVVRSNAIMSPSDSNPIHSLFLPRMVETDYRTDKTEPDSLQRVRDQFDSAIKAA
jgi:DNA ligase-1